MDGVGQEIDEHRLQLLGLRVKAARLLVMPAKRDESSRMISQVIPFSSIHWVVRIICKK